MNATFTTKIQYALLGLSLSVSSTEAVSGTDTSRDLKEIISDLGVLRDNLQSVNRVSREEGLGRQTTEAELAFVRANNAYERSQWLTLIQEIQRYLTLSQKPDPRTWMKAQYLLGRDYEERSQPARAARAYLRYLAAFITSKDTAYNEMNDVLERLVRAATKGSSRTKIELNQFLSSMATLDLPEETVPELKYFLAVGGANIGQKNLATTWISDLTSGPNRPDQKARALNFKALLAMQEGKWIEAEESLQKIVMMPELKGSALDGARLSLARVYLKLRKPKTALDIYNSFRESSSVYREALFEKTFVFIRQNEGSRARNSAIEYLEKYPEHSDAMQMRAIRSWLEIHSGNLTAAKTSVEGTATELERLRNDVQTILSGRDTLGYADTKKVIELTRGVVTASAELESTLSMFEQMADLDARLEEVNGTILNVLYTVAKSDLETYKPSLANRSSQLNQLLTKHMALCERHVQIETDRLANALKPIDRQKLQASMERRRNMNSQTARLERNSKRLVTWLGPAEQLAALAKVWKRTDQLRFPKSETSQPQSQIARIRNEMLKTLAQIRHEQVKNLVDQSPLTEIRDFFNLFSASIHDSESILTSYEPSEGQTLDLLDDNDSQSAWRQISMNTEQLNLGLESLERDAKKDIQSLLAQIDRLLAVRSRLSMGIKDVRSVLEAKAGTASATILAHYDSVLGQRIARQQKWSGDIDYLSYSAKSSQYVKDQAAHELELQVLSDNLWNSENGGGQKWQR